MESISVQQKVMQIMIEDSKTFRYATFTFEISATQFYRLQKGSQTFIEILSMSFADSDETYEGVSKSSCTNVISF